MKICDGTYQYVEEDQQVYIQNWNSPVRKDKPLQVWAKSRPIDGSKTYNYVLAKFVDRWEVALFGDQTGVMTGKTLYFNYKKFELKNEVFDSDFKNGWKRKRLD